MAKNKKNNTAKIITWIIVAALVALGCYATYDTWKTADENVNVSSTNVSVETVSIVPGSDATSKSGYEPHEWTVDIAPNGYAVSGPAVVEYDLNPGEYHYSGSDDLGRTQAAYASITRNDFDRELVEDREKFGSDADKISGWGHNVKAAITFPNGKTYKDYFFNRSHLIADSIGGAPVKGNLVTGSRFQNVGSDNKGGMAYAEELARTWLSTAGTDEFLYYAATPVYVGDELVPRSVYVDIASSDGELDEHIEVFNVSGDVSGHVDIDYATGEVLVDGVAMTK